MQILRYVVEGGRTRFTAYELNLVLNDGERINFAGYIKPRKARVDASAVAEFLGKPVWDAS